MSENLGQAVIAGVSELLPVLRERAQETEDARVVPADSVKALTEIGFFRLLQPARFGGLEADPFDVPLHLGPGMPPTANWVRTAAAQRAEMEGTATA